MCRVTHAYSPLEFTCCPLQGAILVAVRTQRLICIYHPLFRIQILCLFVGCGRGTRAAPCKLLRLKRVGTNAIVVMLMFEILLDTGNLLTSCMSSWNIQGVYQQRTCSKDCSPKAYNRNKFIKKTLDECCINFLMLLLVMRLIFINPFYTFNNVSAKHH